jgi:hypothetical protein
MIMRRTNVPIWEHAIKLLEKFFSWKKNSIILLSELISNNLKNQNPYLVPRRGSGP